MERTFLRLGQALIDNIPVNFEGNVIFDVSELDDQLSDSDIQNLENREIRSRFLLRRPFAVFTGSATSNHSRGLMQNILDCQGLTVQQFSELEDAKNWLRSNGY